jgi:hypothetical protein
MVPLLLVFIIWSFECYKLIQSKLQDMRIMPRRNLKINIECLSNANSLRRVIWNMLSYLWGKQWLKRLELLVIRVCVRACGRGHVWFTSGCRHSLLKVSVLLGYGPGFLSNRFVVSRQWSGLQTSQTAQWVVISQKNGNLRYTAASTYKLTYSLLFFSNFC